MSENRWTKGPWKQSQFGGFIQDDGSGNYHVMRRVPYSSCWIESAWCESDGTDESRANDALICAAPDLAEALQKAPEFKSIDAFLQSDAAKLLTQEWPDLLAFLGEYSVFELAARAALSKARGTP